MSNKILWSHEADGAILHLRAAGLPWHAVAGELRVGRNAVIERARRLGLPPLKLPRPQNSGRPAIRNDRPPLSPGHPTTWSAITQGTVLEGAPYPYPVFL